jgi:hypothetical protein
VADDLRNNGCVAWCPKCKAIVVVAATPADAERLANLHERTAHPKSTPAQTQFEKGPVNA